MIPAFWQKTYLRNFIILLFIFSFALFFRVYFCYDKVFSEPIKYSADDGVYHMRLVENELLGSHFPSRIYFDPYTYFPYGTYIHFAPLYTQLLSGFIWLVSLGKPTLELINKIAPFYPAVLGSLNIFLVYFLAKAVWNSSGVGFLCSFLISIMPPFLNKSLLGGNDHHVAEVLFSTLTMMFLIFALRAKNKEKKIEEKENNNDYFLGHIRNEVKRNKKFWLFVFLSGISLGLYFLTWSGALLFLFIIFAFIVLYYFINYLFLKKSSNWILLMGIFIFLIALAMIAPFFGRPDLFHTYMFNIQHLQSFIFGMLGFIFILAIDFFIKKKKMSRFFLLVFIGLISILFFIILKLFLPFLFQGIIESFKGVSLGMVSHPNARELISEMRPLGLGGAFDYFSASFYLSLVALFIILYKFIKNNKPEYLLILVWTVIIIIMSGIIPLWGQNRFNYYLSVNVALLAGFLVAKGLKFGWQGLNISQRIVLSPSLRPYFTIGSLLIIFNLVFFLIFPFPLNIGKSYPDNLPDILASSLGTAKNGPHIKQEDWYSSLTWLKENTPDPGIDYYGLYEEPGFNEETGKINPYPYPEESYGVLAKWDVGHMLTYYAHRIPVANPFQQGIGRKENGKVSELGQAIFFIEDKEARAVEYLKELKVRYIITDYKSAQPEGQFLKSVEWAQQGDLEGYLELEQQETREPSKFDNSMIARLHLLDGTGTTTEREVDGEKINFYIKPLNYLRLVYESDTTVAFSLEKPGDVMKAIKIFEYVKAARIKGRGRNGTEVVISTEITTNQARNFVYQEEAEVKDGYFEFIVPYSTFGKKGRLEGETQFSVFAQPYKIKIQGKEIEINVSEKDVLNGATIEI